MVRPDGLMAGSCPAIAVHPDPGRSIDRAAEWPRGAVAHAIP
jgi:hypothetical protein